MKVMAYGLRTVAETGRYTSASFEYAGLFSYSVIKRGSISAKQCAVGIAKPVYWAVTRPFVFATEKSKKIFAKRASLGKNVMLLEQKVLKLENRLAELEKKGVVFAMQAAADRQKKECSAEKRMLFQAILAENKLLRQGA